MSDAEIWRPVVGWEGLYEASSQGEIRSVDRVRVRVNRWGSPASFQLRGKVLRASIGTNGYLGVVLADSGRERPLRSAMVHRLICEAFHGPCPNGYQAAHSDGVKTNNRASNLSWASPLENQSHRVVHGTHARGDTNVKSTLSNADVAEIRRLRGKVLQSELACRYRVSFQHISAIQLGKQRPYG